MYQPKTGLKCSCRHGIERDNCPKCEGTGQQIDFAKIRGKSVEKATSQKNVNNRKEFFGENGIRESDTIREE